MNRYLRRHKRKAISMERRSQIRVEISTYLEESHRDGGKKGYSHIHHMKHENRSSHFKLYGAGLYERDIQVKGLYNIIRDKELIDAYINTLEKVVQVTVTIGG